MMENAKNRPHTITAHIEIPLGAGEGVLIAQGARFGGWSLYMKGVKSNTVTTGSTEIATPSSPRIGFPPAERPSNSNLNTTAAPVAKAALECPM
jgi:hypothetical protein